MHDCVQEAKIAVLQEQGRNMGDDIKAMRSDIKAILDEVKGNGKPGLRTEVELLKQAQAKIWWAVSGVGGAVLGIGGYVLRGWVS